MWKIVILVVCVESQCVDLLNKYEYTPSVDWLLVELSFDRQIDCFDIAARELERYKRNNKLLRKKTRVELECRDSAAK